MSHQHRVLSQETALPALHSSRGIFNVFDRRLPATVMAGGLLSLGKKLARDGRLDMDTETTNSNPNIAWTVLSFFFFMAMISEMEVFWKEASSILKPGSQEWQTWITLLETKWLYKEPMCLSVYHFHCLFFESESLLGEGAKELVMFSQAFRHGLPNCWHIDHIGVHRHTDMSTKWYQYIRQDWPLGVGFPKSSDPVPIHRLSALCPEALGWKGIGY